MPASCVCARARACVRERVAGGRKREGEQAITHGQLLAAQRDLSNKREALLGSSEGSRRVRGGEDRKEKCILVAILSMCVAVRVCGQGRRQG